MIGDITGFAAADLSTGIPLLCKSRRVLVAQVDSSVGGKTGWIIQRENLIGAFNQPRAVLIDPVTLTYVAFAGMDRRIGRKVIKYGSLPMSRFEYLEQHIAQILMLTMRPSHTS